MPTNGTPAKRPPPETESYPPTKASTQATFVLNNTSRVTPREQVSLRRQLMRFIASTNIRFVVVENVEFQKFGNMMRGPTFHLPNRHVASSGVSDALLPQLYGGMELAFWQVTKGRNLTMLMDGWSDAKKDPTLGYGVTVEEKISLDDLHDTIGEQHSITIMVPHAKEKIKYPGERYETKVGRVVVDNAATMVGMRRSCTVLSAK